MCLDIYLYYAALIESNLLTVSIEWFHVWAGGTEVCTYVVVCVGTGFTTGVMSHWNWDVTDAFSKSNSNCC